MRKVHDVVQNNSDVEKKVRKATSQKSSGPTGAQMAEIAKMTYSPTALNDVMDTIWKRFSDHSKYWKHIYKALILLEYIIKVGSEDVALRAQKNLYAIDTLKNFQHIDKKDVDQGQNVRNAAKRIVNLLKNPQELKEERSRAIASYERINGTSISSQGSLARRSNKDGSNRVASNGNRDVGYSNEVNASRSADRRAGAMLAKRQDDETLEAAMRQSRLDYEQENQRKLQLDQHDPDLQAALALSMVKQSMQQQNNNFQQTNFGNQTSDPFSNNAFAQQPQQPSQQQYNSNFNNDPFSTNTSSYGNTLDPFEALSKTHSHNASFNPPPQQQTPRMDPFSSSSTTATATATTTTTTPHNISTNNPWDRITSVTNSSPSMSNNNNNNNDVWSQLDGPNSKPFSTQEPTIATANGTGSNAWDMLSNNDTSYTSSPSAFNTNNNDNSLITDWDLPTAAPTSTPPSSNHHFSANRNDNVNAKMAEITKNAVEIDEFSRLWRGNQNQNGSTNNNFFGSDDDLPPPPAPALAADTDSSKNNNPWDFGSINDSLLSASASPGSAANGKEKTLKSKPKNDLWKGTEKLVNLDSLKKSASSRSSPSNSLNRNISGSTPSNPFALSDGGGLGTAGAMNNNNRQRMGIGYSHSQNSSPNPMFANTSNGFNGGSGYMGTPPQQMSMTTMHQNHTRMPQQHPNIMNMGNNMYQPNYVQPLTPTTLQPQLPNPYQLQQQQKQSSSQNPFF